MIMRQIPRRPFTSPKFPYEFGAKDNSISIDKKDLPWDEWKPFRKININGKDVEFSEGFTELHKLSYEKIINGEGFGLDDVEPTIKLIEKIR